MSTRSTLLPHRQQALFTAAALLLATLGATSTAAASPPGYCRTLGRPSSYRGGGPVLVATSSDRETISIDGTDTVGGPLLVVGLSLGKHRIVVHPETGAPKKLAFDLGADRRALIVPAGATLGRQRSFRLSLVGVAALREVGDEAPAVVKAPRLVARPIRADDLARFHCDPVLGPRLPPVSALLAATEAACDRDEAAACATAAEQWFSEVGVRPRSPEKAVARLEHACRLGVADSCEVLARMVEIGNGARKDPERAARLLEDTCRGGHAKSCATRSWALLPSSPTLTDRERAAPLMQQACALDSGFCGPAREQQLRLACGRGDRGACELLLPGDSVRVAIEAADGTEAKPVR